MSGMKAEGWPCVGRSSLTEVQGERTDGKTNTTAFLVENMYLSHLGTFVQVDFRALSFVYPTEL